MYYGKITTITTGTNTPPDDLAYTDGLSTGEWERGSPGVLHAVHIQPTEPQAKARSSGEDYSRKAYEAGYY